MAQPCRQCALFTDQRGEDKDGLADLLSRSLNEAEAYLNAIAERPLLKNHQLPNLLLTNGRGRQNSKSPGL